MRKRIVLHQQARITFTQCTDSEGWAKSDVWAVMKRNRKSALKLYSNENEATIHASLEPGLFVQYRKGASTRCNSYCSVSQFCQQFQEKLDAKEQQPEQLIGKIKS